MSYVTAQARAGLLEALAAPIEHIGAALAALGVAYELLDDETADRLEATLFRPAQLALGGLRRTHDEFAARHGLTSRTFEAEPAPAPSHGVHWLLEEAVVDAGAAATAIAELQDSMLPVEVGDQELRAGLAATREHLDKIRAGARELLRTFGR